MYFKYADAIYIYIYILALQKRTTGEGPVIPWNARSAVTKKFYSWKHEQEIRKSKVEVYDSHPAHKNSMFTSKAGCLIRSKLSAQVHHEPFN